MRDVGVSAFREHMLSYLKHVEQGEEIILTSRGREIAVITPPDTQRRKARQSLQALRKTANLGDVLTPVTDGWAAAK